MFFGAITTVLLQFPGWNLRIDSGDFRLENLDFLQFWLCMPLNVNYFN